MKDVGRLALMEKRADILDNLCVFATKGEKEEIAKRRYVVCCFRKSCIEATFYFINMQRFNMSEHCTGIAEVIGWNPVKAFLFATA